ncbi:MAG: hypothetical protein IPH88_18600 [Bacteroidales bacterium]|nr:hypothetical protein [Bacteroidales bacterium]
MKSFEFDATECQDLFPPAAALTFSLGTRGLPALRDWSMRKATGQWQRGGIVKSGIRVWIEGNDLFIASGQPNGGNVSSHSGHRIAMMAAVCYLGAKAKVVIKGAECGRQVVSGVFEDLQKIGVNIKYSKSVIL